MHKPQANGLEVDSLPKSQNTMTIGPWLRVLLAYGAKHRGPYISLFGSFKHHLFGP